MKPFVRWTALALAVTCVPITAMAHRTWMLPSATVLSGQDLWVTIDAAVSNDLFYFEHFPLRIAGLEPEGPEATTGRGGRPAELVITAPDGSRARHQHGNIGRYRSTFDVQLTQPGTYKIATINDGAFATYRENGENRRWSGPIAEVAAKVPANADRLRVVHSQTRMEVFVTAGKPTETVLKTTGSGLELQPITHPNDLVAGTEARFALLLDGKPIPNLDVTIIPGGIRYRDKLNEMKVTTGADGSFAVTWPEPGMYWLNASAQTPSDTLPNATRRASYTATLEVLPQ